MKKLPHIPKEAIYVLAGVFLFISVSMTLHLISASIAETVSLPDVTHAEMLTEPSVEADETGAEPPVPEYEMSEADDQTHPVQPVSDAAQPVAEQDSPVTEAAQQAAPTEEIAALTPVPGVSDVNYTSDTVETVIDGLLQSFTDYEIRFEISEHQGSAQSVNYIRGSSLYTDIVAEMPDGTLHFTVNRTADQDGTVYAALVTELSERFGITVPVAAELKLSEAPTLQTAQVNEHDAPVIIR